MLGSGVSLAPLSYKKVEHRDEILYYKSTTQSQERMISMLNQDYTAKVLNLEDVIITNVENISDVLHIYLELPRQKGSFFGRVQGQLWRSEVQQDCCRCKTAQGNRYFTESF